MTRRHGCRAALLAAGALAVLLIAAGVASANTVTMTSCLPGQGLPQPPWSSVSSAPSALTPGVSCASGGRLQLKAVASRTAPLHAYEQWDTSVPSAMRLRTFSFPAQAALLSTTLTNHPGGGTSGYSARFLSAAGSVTFIDDGQPGGGGMDYARAGTWAIGGKYFALDVNCSRGTVPKGGCIEGQQDSADLLDIKNFVLVAEDDQPPTVTAPGGAPAGGTNLWSAGPWERGIFNLAFTATNATGSGVCVSAAALGGRSLPSPAGAVSAPNTTVWQQCPASYLYQQAVDTTGYPNGRTNLDLYAADAASPNNTTPLTKTIGIDNAPVTISLTGPSDVAASAANASAAITVTATAGPSGANIFCSVDGGPGVEYSGSGAQVPVSGLGAHQASCYAQNGAVDAHGMSARSATQTFNLSIRQPTAQAVTFAHIADALRCRTVVQKVRVRGKSRVIRRHGKRVLVRGRTRTLKKRVRRCHARTVKRTVWVVLKRHGKPVKRHGKIVRVRRVRRVVVLPHPVLKAKRRVGHGRATTVSGYLGLADGTPLAGRAVAVIAAPDNGLGQFTLPIATVTTSASGTWTAKVPAGPSRLIEAVYGGGPTEEPAGSAPVTLTVPARLRLLSVTPRVPWGGAVHIAGKLYGGYLPPGGAVIQLREGYGRHARTTFGVLHHVTGSGRFLTTFRFGPGPAGLHVRYWFSALLVAHPDYPWAAASSQRRYVLVGGHATVSAPPRHHRRGTGHAHRHHRGHSRR